MNRLHQEPYISLPSQPDGCRSTTEHRKSAAERLLSCADLAALDKFAPSPTRALLDAARMSEDGADIEDALAEGADIEAVDPGGFSALALCVMHGNLDGVKVLLRRGCSTRCHITLQCESNCSEGVLAAVLASSNTRSI